MYNDKHHTHNKIPHSQKIELAKSLAIIIEHVNEYPTIHYFGNPRHTLSMIAYILLTECFWKFQRKIACPIDKFFLLVGWFTAFYSI